MAQNDQTARRARYVGAAACLGTTVASAVYVALSPSRLDHPVTIAVLVAAAIGFVLLSRSTEKHDRFERLRRINDVQLRTVLHDQDFREQDLTNIVLRSRTLDRSAFAGATLIAADLTRASCVGADFAKSKLNAARFELADLSQASLRGADLGDANFNHAILIDTDLRGANMSGADLRDADMSGANLCGADLRNTIVNRTLLKRATFDASTKLPYNLTSDRRASAGLEATIDSSLQPRESVRRKLSFEPGFVVASLASAGIALGVLAIAGVARPPATPLPTTNVAGRVEIAAQDDGRILVIDADRAVEARLAFTTGGTATVLLNASSEIDSFTLQQVSGITLVADGHETIRCTLLVAGQPTAVKRLASGGETLRCPLNPKP